MDSTDFPIGTLFKTTATHALFHRAIEAEKFRLMPVDAKIGIIDVPCFIIDKQTLNDEEALNMEIWQIIVEEKCYWMLVHKNVISRFFVKLNK